MSLEGNKLLVKNLNTLIRQNGIRMQIVSFQENSVIVSIDGWAEFVIGCSGLVTQVNGDEHNAAREAWLEGILAGKSRNDDGELVLSLSQ